jgi:hypothetical protein
MTPHPNWRRIITFALLAVAIGLFVSSMPGFD